MHRLPHAVSLTLALALGCSPASECASFGEQDNAAIKNVLTGQRDAWNRGDLKGYMAGYEQSPELVFTSGAKVRTGWEQTFKQYRARYGNDTTSMGHLEFEQINIRGLGPDGAIAYGRWVLSETPKAGSGIFSLALARTPEGWRVVHDHTSADPTKE